MRASGVASLSQNLRDVVEMGVILSSGGGTTTIKVVSGTLSKLKDGNITADGSEQTLFEFMDIGRVSGYVDLGEMQAGDVIIIREYMKVEDGGAYRRYDQSDYSGLQSDPLLYIHPRETDKAIKLTLQQILGIYRSFPHSFLREL